jgi:restriction system protein
MGTTADMEADMILLATAIVLILIVVLAGRLRIPLRHRWRRRQARAMSIALRGPDRRQPPALIYARLRAMDALAFERRLLESFEALGPWALRNARYTGDGGTDGQVIIAGEVRRIQAKRCADPARSEHVQAFAALCRHRGTRGLLIHTGRTCPCSRAHVAESGYVSVISGRLLIALLRGGPFSRPEGQS